MLHVINKAVVWENGFVKELLVALKLTFSQFIYLFIYFYTEVNQRIHFLVHPNPPNQPSSSSP